MRAVAVILLLATSGCAPRQQKPVKRLIVPAKCVEKAILDNAPCRIVSDHEMVCDGVKIIYRCVAVQ